MSKLNWYWHRLRVMSPAEMARHARKRVRQIADARQEHDWSAAKLECSGLFPKLPVPQDAPTGLRDALARDAQDILAGHWKAFGHLDLKVDDPPRWQCDYLVGRDLTTPASAFELNHRELPGGADIKLIWELSRWYQLVRLAMAAYVLEERRAAEKCVGWLEDWVKHNPPFRGWNWTSALESGLRLVQLTWIDALLAAKAASWDLAARLEALRYQILPPHVWFTWRHRSFGSSANNHLIGELAGLITATVRWPALARWGASLSVLQRRWEQEVLAQFAEDGGNKEQALNYHLFSWEFCWQVFIALHLSGHPVLLDAASRLCQAGEFYVNAQAERDPWDYGDSDGAFVTPFVLSESQARQEWRQWFISPPRAPGLHFWLVEGRKSYKSVLRKAARCWGDSDPELFEPEAVLWARAHSSASWLGFPKSGQAVCRSGVWLLRWDLSPLGYLKTAAHGHLDALHLSIWLNGVAMVVDPGTGAYYAEARLRAWLASRQAHNGPCPEDADDPKRLGPFLWAGHHEVPTVTEVGDGLVGILPWRKGNLKRFVRGARNGLSWTVADGFSVRGNRSGAFTVRWQLAPGAWVKRLAERRFEVHRAGAAMVVEVDEEWAEVELVEPVGEAEHAGRSPPTAEHLEGIVSPAFRQIERAPFLRLTAQEADKPCLFFTTFLASGHS